MIILVNTKMFKTELSVKQGTHLRLRVFGRHVSDKKTFCGVAPNQFGCENIVSPLLAHNTNYLKRTHQQKSDADEAD